MTLEARSIFRLPLNASDVPSSNFHKSTVCVCWLLFSFFMPAALPLSGTLNFAKARLASSIFMSFSDLLCFWEAEPNICFS